MGSHVELDLELVAIEGEDIGLSLVRKGALLAVASVQENSAAWAAGVMLGDGIVRVNGTDATDPRIEPAALVGALKEDAEASLSIWRRSLAADVSAPWTLSTGDADGVGESH